MWNIPRTKEKNREKGEEEEEEEGENRTVSGAMPDLW